MVLRTEIGQVAGSFGIDHNDKLVMLGSCFADSVGRKLSDDGFAVMHNPGGPLYNACSLARMLRRREPYCESDLYLHDGVYHCLDFASRYSSADARALLTSVNTVQNNLYNALQEATVLILTLGTAGIYEFLARGEVAGNCHRLPASLFNRRMLTVAEMVDALAEPLQNIDAHLVITVSPVRYTDGGLTVCGLSKARLRVAADELCRLTGADYFPSYEILNDDLRDYRFYAVDMKHPSDVAVDYIYQTFCGTYMSAATIEQARLCRKEAARARHIPDYHKE